MKKNSNKRSSKKGLVPALLATLCSVGALTSVSYAWFTMGEEASIEQIDVNVQAADGMQISADAASWKSMLPVSELAQREGNLLPGAETLLAPTSTEGKYLNGQQQMFLGTIEDNGNISATLESEADLANAKNYIAFDFFVKLTRDSALHLDAGSFVKDNLQELEDKDSSLASRVSFAYLGTSQSKNDAINLGNAFEGYSKIWEPNFKHHTEVAKDNIEAIDNNKDYALDYTGVNKEIAANEQPNVYGQSFTQFNENNLLRPDYSTEATTLNNDTPNDTSDDKNIPEWGTTESAYLFNLKSGISKIRVYVWLEGQDIDCTNEISEGSFSIGLNFKKTDTVLEGLELPETETVEMGNTITLAALNKNGLALPKGTDVEWELVSSNNNCLTIDSETGEITPVAAGEAVVKAKVAYQDGQETKYHEDTCTVTVTEAADNGNA